MASLQLIQSAPTRTLPFLSLAPRFLALRPSWSLSCEPSSSAASSPRLAASSTIAIDVPAAAAGVAHEPSAVVSAPWYTSLLPSISSLLELLPPILLAVPKKKVSHSRKRMRSNLKGPRNKTNFSICSACGQPKLSHNLCPNCYSQISRRWKAEGRGEDITIKARQSTAQAPGVQNAADVA